MILSIDTTNKTIQVKSTVNLDELLRTLESLGIDYIEYTLIPDVQIMKYPSINISDIPNHPLDRSDIYYREPTITSTSTSSSTVYRNSPDNSIEITR